MEVTIKKAAIRGRLFLSYEFDQTELGVKNSIKTSSDQPIHEDLRNAFKNLIPHFAFICEEVRDQKLVKKAIKDPEDYLMNKEEAKDVTFFKYHVFQFSIIEKKDGGEYISISGSKQLESLEEISFATPNISLHDDEYPLLDELNETIDELKSEVLAYMQGKAAPKAQMTMFGDDDEDDFDGFDDFEKQAAETSKILKKKLKDAGIDVEVSIGK